MKDIIHMVSVSGGKDSTATLLLALKQFPPESVFAAFADTGNEHERTLEYLDYLERRLGVRIARLKADFSERFDSRRDWVLNKWPLAGVPVEKCEQAAKLLVPTGIPFLDLCMLKGRFPSRMAQFCTQELKTKPLTEYAMWITDMFDADVWSWQGVRRDESARRANALGFENLTGGIYAWRPIAGWTAQETVDFVLSCGVELNPLYKEGMGRVGCMPCINANKEELAEIARRFPHHVERIAEWERIVADVSKCGNSSFFPAPTSDNRGALRGNNIHSVVRWAKTTRGGLVPNPEYDEPAPACASSYGLCE